jgi:hypothetical protein
MVCWIYLRLELSKNRLAKNMSLAQESKCVCKVKDFFDNFFATKVEDTIDCMCAAKKLQKVLP